MRPNDPPFLQPVGRAERNPLRWLAWAGLVVVFAFTGLLFLGPLLDRLDVLELARTAGVEPLPEGPRRPVEEARLMFVLSITLALLAVAVLLAARVAFRRPAWTFVTPVRRFRLRPLLAGFVVFGVLVLASLVIERLIVGEALEGPLLDPSHAWDARLIYLGGAFLFLLLAAAAEELVFRGVFLQLLGAVIPHAAALVAANGLLFSAMHFDPSPGAFVARAVSGAVWAWTVLRLGGLEFALGAHFANNLFLSTLASPFSEGAQVGREIPWPYLLGDVVILLLTVGVVRAALGSERARAWLGGPEGLSPPAVSAGGREASRRDESRRDGRS